VVGGLCCGDLGLVRAHVGGEGGAPRGDVLLETSIGGVGDAVPAAPGVDARHQPVGHIELLAKLEAHVGVRVHVGGPHVHGLTPGVHKLPVAIGDLWDVVHVERLEFNRFR
jgi:hypothetical protein